MLDVNRTSRNLMADARRAANSGGSDISHLFSPKYLREVNGVARLGETSLADFVRASREGNFRESFGRAFPNNRALDEPAVQRTIRDMLADSKRTLPDFRVAERDRMLRQLEQATGVDLRKLATTEQLEQAVKSSPKLRQQTEELTKVARSSGKVNVLGYTLTFAAGVTAADIYDKMVDLAAKQSGCFAYYMSDNRELRKCKVLSYSCAHADKFVQACVAAAVPVLEHVRDDCQKTENKAKNCLHCSNDDAVNAQFADHVTLRCEEKSAGELLGEAINETLGNVWTGVTGGISSFFRYGLIALIAIVVLVLVLNFLK